MASRLALSILLWLLLAACTSAPARPQTDAVHEVRSGRPAHAAGWMRSELYFGAGPLAGDAPGVIGDAQWRAFLDAEVTPRFPDGLTVIEAYGQWRYHGTGTPERQRARVLVVLHEDTPQRRADIEAIRAAWKHATGHQSVLWSRQPVEVSF